jgi:DNA polymerase III delta' subunit
MGFDAILDQPIPIRLLRNIITSNRIPNALLFWGPSGVGKRLTAFELAKAINCSEAEADACGTCLSCRKIDHGNHPDVHVTVPVKKSRIINVDAISDIIELAVLRPFEGQWRIFIIQDADRMYGPGQNHLLKTLEEPAGQTLFVLITEHPQGLLPTIRSRCQSVRFGGLTPETIKQLLMRDRDVDDAAATSIAAVAQGQMTRAFELVDSEKREIVFSFLRRLGDGENPLRVSEEFGKYLASERAAIEAAVKSQADPVDAAELSKEDRERIKEEQQAVADAQGRRGILEMLYLMETWYRDKMVLRATEDSTRVLNRDRLGELRSADGEDLEHKLGAIGKARLYLERFLNEERVFRDLFFVLAR